MTKYIIVSDDYIVVNEHGTLAKRGGKIPALVLEGEEGHAKAQVVCEQANERARMGLTQHRGQSFKVCTCAQEGASHE